MSTTLPFNSFASQCVVSGGCNPSASDTRFSGEFESALACRYIYISIPSSWFFFDVHKPTLRQWGSTNASLHDSKTANSATHGTAEPKMTVKGMRDKHPQQKPQPYSSRVPNKKLTKEPCWDDDSNVAPGRHDTFWLRPHSVVLFR